jgi:excinuclease UvrABC nuclease subunit
LKWLQQRYDFAYYPLRIECLDISHFAGDRASGGLSAMDGGIANKKWYRRYKIKKATWGDDYGSLKEVIIRRFGQRHVIARNEAERNDEAISNDIDQIATSEQSWFPASSQWRDFLPDLFVLDGAEKQLEVVKKLLESWTIDKELLNKVQFASLGKGDARKSWQKIKGEKEKLYVLKAKEQKGEKAKTIDGVMLWIVDYEFQYDEVDRVLLRLRDEAHRFANSYREKQQSMELTTKKTIKK